MGNTQSVTTCGRPDAAKELLRAANMGDAHLLSSVIDADVRLAFHYTMFGGNSAWHKAAKGGHTAALKALAAAVFRQYELDSKDLNEFNRIPVLRPGSSASDVIKCLVNKANVKGLTPLMLACSGGHTDAVAFLIKHGADVWKHERNRRHTALHCAAEAGATGAIRLLLARAGTELHPGNKRTLLEQGNHAGLTALHYAVYCAQHEVVAQLVAQDADITAQAEFPDLDWGCINAGDTAMHVAAHKGNIEAIQVMLKAYNERSGALMPSQDGSRRLRDPRAMRNDYGRLPYHLAMRKGLSWLGEMLDPSVPVRFLLTDEQLDVNSIWGPPRLTTIAAAVLHKSLVADLKAIQAAQQLNPAHSAVTPQEDKAPAQQTAAVWQPPLQVTASTAAEASSSSSSSTAAHRRLWCRPGHRRANSDASGWLSRLPELSTRPASAGRRGSAGLLSRRPRPASPSSSSTTQPALVPPASERSQLQEAFLGQLSPRALVAALVGAGGGDEDASSAAAGRTPEADVDAAANTGSTSWRRLVTRSGRHPSHDSFNNKQQQPTCTSPEPEQTWAVDGVYDGAHQDLKAPPGRTLLRSASDSGVCFAQEGEQPDWPKLMEPEELTAAHDKDPAEHEPGTDPAIDGSGEGSPLLPEVKPDMPDAALDALLQEYIAQLRRGSSLSHSLQPQPGQQQCGSSDGEEGPVCGVCLDALPSAHIEPCGHAMCAECALDMCEHCPLGTAMCPYCRTVIKQFLPATHSLSSTSAGAGHHQSAGARDGITALPVLAMA